MYVSCHVCVYIPHSRLVVRAIAPRDAHRRAPRQPTGAMHCILVSIYIRYI